MKGKVIKTAAEAATGTPEVKTAPVAEKAATVKTVEAKETPEAEVKEEVKETAEATNTAAAKATGKKTTSKAAGTKKTTAKAETAAAKAAGKKAEIKAGLTIQYGGKSYSQEELMKIAKDVWEFDLKKKVGDLKSVELYVKPEENICYYVMNDETGSFAL